MFDLPPRPEYFSPEHETFRRSLRGFVEREIEPNVAAWDEAGGFPRELYRKAAAIGLIGMGYPEDLGGTPADLFFGVVSAEELARAGSGTHPAAGRTATLATLRPAGAAERHFLRPRAWMAAGGT